MATPRRCCREVRQWPPLKLKTSMACLLGVLSGFSAAATIEVEDVDDGPPVGCCRQVWHWPPLKLETSMAAPLVAATTEVEDGDGGPPGGAVGISDSGHH
jgi:hypothetical protein